MNEEIKYETEIEHTEVALSESVDDLEKNIKSTDDIPLEGACIYGLSIRNKRGVFTVKDEFDKFSSGDQVVVRTCRGKEVATVKYVQLNKMLEREREIDIKRVIRLVNEQDLDAERRNREKEKSAMEIAQKKSDLLKLKMSFVRSEFLFDSARIIFYFLAPQKVDFRELVRLLSREFRTRIELRQISNREYVGLNGAIGACGRQTCCSSFLTKTPKVNVRMVENQRLSKNPSKLNGVCGHLKCCISYENDFYREALEGIPRRSSCVGCSSGKKGKVCGTNIFKDEVTIRLEDSTYMNVSLEEARNMPVLEQVHEAEDSDYQDV
ncbi:MAG: regulatory iron-sulfur-containing complex subunit RicT [bacterium]|nr:regulatory iron-sulfur-containing complex subunit RicT [bacterium]